MSETLDILPGEGETKTVTSKRVRRECAECGEPAHYQQTYLLHGARTNPASKAYGMDDCSWCSDLDHYFCREHKDHGRRNPPRGYEPCSVFYANEQFAHRFLRWEEVKP